MNARIELTSDEIDSLLDKAAEVCSIDIDDNPLHPLVPLPPLRELGAMAVAAGVAYINALRGFGEGSL